MRGREGGAGLPLRQPGQRLPRILTPGSSATAMAAGALPQDEQPYSASVHPTGRAADVKGASGRPAARYTKVGERLRHAIPGPVACSMACGGRACKYENPARWTEQEQAIAGLYSSWVTESILAMARPSTELLEKYGVIEQFRSHGLKTVINLQRPGEHASCGNPLERRSGFTYLPEAFMEAGIYFYNFGWKDYGVASLTTILDMVKVMAFALQEGKVAVHCHAGLGRTGVLIACYLAFATRMTADQAIALVRAKRPNSIQTRGQLLCVREFTQFLVPLRHVFAGRDPGGHAVTLAQYLSRQRHLLHGYEARLLKHVPKIVHLVCRLLLGLAENRPAAPERPAGAPGLPAGIEAVAMPLDRAPLRPAAGASGLCSEHEADPPREAPDPESRRPRTRLQRQLSGSDSELQRAPALREPSGAPRTVLAQGSLGHSPPQPAPPPGSNEDTLGRGTVAFWHRAGSGGLEGRQDDGSPAFPRKQLARGAQRRRTFSSGVSGPHNPGEPAAPRFADTPQEPHHAPRPGAPCRCAARGGGCSPCCGAEDSAADRGPGPGEQPSVAPETPDSRGVRAGPPATPSAQGRRVLAARALAGFQEAADGEAVRRKVGMWQEELNSRDGAWERICGEKDPFVLCGLMWSWVAQLKEPVITPGDVDLLVARRPEPADALSLLQKDQHQTVLCVLHCAASLRTVPADLEEAVLAQAIRAFTKVPLDSEKGPVVYDTLRKIFKHTLDEQRKGTRDSPQPAVQCG